MVPHRHGGWKHILNFQVCSRPGHQIISTPDYREILEVVRISVNKVRWIQPQQTTKLKKHQLSSIQGRPCWTSLAAGLEAKVARSASHAVMDALGDPFKICRTYFPGPRSVPPVGDPFLRSVGSTRKVANRLSKAHQSMKACFHQLSMIQQTPSRTFGELESTRHAAP